MLGSLFYFPEKKKIIFSHLLCSSGCSSGLRYAPNTLNSAVLMGYKILYDDGLNGAFNEVRVDCQWDGNDLQS